MRVYVLNRVLFFAAELLRYTNALILYFSGGCTRSFLYSVGLKRKLL